MRCCPWPWTSSSAERPSTSRRFTSLPSVAPTILPFDVATTTTSGSGIVPGRGREHADRHAGADRRHDLALGEDLGVRPDADFEILRPQALGLQHLLQFHRLRRAGLDLLDRAAERAFHVLARRSRALRRAARLLLDHALEQRDRERDARRLHGLQVDRREQMQALSDRACLPPCWRGSRRDRRCGPRARPRPTRPGRATRQRSRIVANEREMSNTPSARTATTDGPPSSGRHTRPTSVPAVASVGRVDLRSICMRVELS